jgi:ABC-type transport system involved in cytochrome bd biosynthesis fused ATPase/permease subunit
MKYIVYSTPPSSNPLRKVLAIVVTTVLAVLGIMFSAVLLSVVLVVVVVGGIFLWWKTRKIREQLNQMQSTMRDARERAAQRQNDVFNGEVYEGEIIEGEATRVDERGPR